MSFPQISVIVVSYNTRELLAACLRSLARAQAEAELEVIVVDNASTDGSAELVRRDFPEVRLVELAVNSGFAAANNIGFEQAQGEFLWILNPDTIVPRGTLSRLKAFLQDHPRAAVAGAGLTGVRGRAQASSFVFPSLFREFLNFLPEIKAILRPRETADFLKRLRYRESGRVVRRPEPQQVPCVSGAAFLARADAIRQVGGFDTGFFLYHEEMDLCRRLLDAGWEVWLVPAAQVIHLEGQATGCRSGRLPHLPVLEWRIAGMDRLWAKHTSPARHRRWRVQARALLRVRVAAHRIMLPFAGRRAEEHRRRIEEYRRILTLLSLPTRSKEAMPARRTA